MYVSMCLSCNTPRNLSAKTLTNLSYNTLSRHFFRHSGSRGVEAVPPARVALSQRGAVREHRLHRLGVCVPAVHQVCHKGDGGGANIEYVLFIFFAISNIFAYTLIHDCPYLLTPLPGPSRTSSAWRRWLGCRLGRLAASAGAYSGVCTFIRVFTCVRVCSGCYVYMLVYGCMQIDYSPSLRLSFSLTLTFHILLLHLPILPFISPFPAPPAAVWSRRRGNQDSSPSTR